MKTLYIVRHAKSSWDDASVRDFDRPLNDRGNHDAPRMAKRLRERNVHPDLMITSPALRALTTCEKIADILGYPLHKIKKEDELYHASEDEIMAIVRNIKDHDKDDVVMIFGHNPGLTDFVNSLMNESIFNVPTCGIVCCRLDVDNWKDVQWGEGQQVFFDYPKSRDD